MLGYLTVIIGSVWRRWNGMNHEEDTTIFKDKLPRRVVGFALAIVSAYIGLGCNSWIDGVSILILASGAILALVKGFDGWTSWRNIFQFYPAYVGLALVSFIRGNVDQLNVIFYLLLCLLAGAMWPIGHRLKQKWDRYQYQKWGRTRWYEFQYTIYAETFAGGVVIGGLSWI